MNVNLKKKFCILTLIILIILSAVTLYTVNQVSEINGQVLSVNSYKHSDIQLNSALQCEKTKETVNFKLFGFIPIGKTQIDTNPEKYVILGGNPIGIAIKTMEPAGISAPRGQRAWWGCGKRAGRRLRHSQR